MIDNSIKVEAFCDGVSVGVYDSISMAARALYIRNPETINTYLNGNKHMTFKGKRRGVKSYKGGKLYHFKKIA